MLLIQSDLIKALWFVIFPVVTYTRGPVQSDSTFCQVSGFFFAVGIESSDVAVLLIALHSAMYIYRPKSGLYPYRWLAYATYVVVPLLFASLAFLDGGYRNVGYFCYLSNERGWASLAFSWIPRYVLFALILVIYICIYAYVRGRIHHYERRDSAAPQALSAHFATRRAYRDRIRSLPTSFKPSAGRYKDRLRAVSISNPSSSRWTEDSSPTGPILWNLPRFEDASPSVDEGLADEQDPRYTPQQHLDLPPPTASPSWRNSTPKDASPLSSINTEGWHLPMLSETSASDPPQTGNSTEPLASDSHRQGSCTTIPAMFPVCRKALRAGGGTPSSSSHEESGAYLGEAALTLHISHDPLTSHVSRNRDKVRRQLRSLFVYPLLYLVMWIFPLVNQVYGYTTATGYSSSNRPRWVYVLSLVSLAVQGAADSAVFTTREKPWRYTAGEGFWASVGWGWGWSSRGWRRDGVGRTREEVLVEVRNARARRKAEVVDEVRREKKRREAEQRRDWWDVKEYDVASDGWV